MVQAQVPVRTVPPTELPVSLDQLRMHLKDPDRAEDNLILMFAEAAVGHLDGWAGILGRCLCTQTWRRDYDGFPACGIVDLPFPDVASATVAYTDPAGAPQTFAAGSYQLATGPLGSRVALKDGQSWPAAATAPDAVRITMVAGFGVPAAVPPALRAAILLHVGTMFEYRTTVAEKAMPTMTYDALVAPWRRVL